jgi:hypothetical protein
MNLKKYNWQEYTTKEGLMNLLRETNEDNLIRLAVKELVDNAIDANRKAQQGKRSEDYIPCELGKTDNGFYIRDYGNGFSEKDVKTLFNLKRNFSYSSKYIRTINRGMLGKGLRMVLGICCIYGGRIRLYSRGKSYEIIPDKNTGEVEISISDGDIRKGTKIEIDFKNLDFNESFLSWGIKSLKLDKTWFYIGYTNPWWYSEDDLRILLTNFQNEKVRKFAKKIFNIKINKESKFYKLKIIDLLKNSQKRIFKELLKELRSKAKTNVKFNKIGKLEGYKYYKYTSHIEEINDKKIPFTVEVWATNFPLAQNIYTSFFKFFLNGSFIETIEYKNSDKDNNILLFFSGNILTVKKIKCSAEFLVNILTPWIQTEGEDKKPILSKNIKNEIENLLNKMITKIQNNNNKSIMKVKNNNEWDQLIGQDNLNKAKEKADELMETINKLELNITDKHNLLKAISYNGICKAAWFYKHWKSMGESKLIHLRRIHYHLVSKNAYYIVKGKIVQYTNTNTCWKYLVEASTNARILRLVDPTVIIDRRNPQMINNTTNPTQNLEIISGKIPLLDMIYNKEDITFPEPKVELTYSGLLQPNIVVVITEKTTINDIIEPLQQKYQFIFQPAQGFLSYTMASQLAELITKYNKPLIILYISDFDPSGVGMPSALAQQLEIEFIQRKLFNHNLKIIHVALTQEQIKEYNLPPVPEVSKKGYEKFKNNYKMSPTELDALEAYYPGELQKILEKELSHYIDISMAQKIENMKNNILHEIKKSIQKNDKLNNLKKQIKNDYKKLFSEIIENNRNHLDKLSHMFTKYKDELSIHLESHKTKFDKIFDKIQPLVDNQSTSNVILDITKIFNLGLGYYLSKRN